MEKDCPPPPPPSESGGSSKNAAVQSSLRALNKSSHKISKTHMRNPQVSVPVAKPEPPADDTHQPPPQPPVYNIDKNDFRDVVQKLTGSPALPAVPAAPTATAPTKPATVAASRFQKNRPPPLSQLGPRPPLPMAPPEAVDGGAAGGYLRPWMNTPLSPLPPLPTVSAAAESPITAYMRCLRGGSAAPAGAVGGGAQAGSVGVPLFQMPTLPLGFGCLRSPHSAFQATVPSSPRLPIPSPKWKET